MRYSTSVIFILFLCTIGYSQSGDYHMGARAMALGNAVSTVSDEWASFNNIGAFAGDRLPSVFFGYKNNYGIPGLNVVAAGFNSCYRQFGGTLTFFRFGDEYFNENKIGLGITHKIDFVSLGFQANYLQYVIENHGSAGAVYFDFGGLAEIVKGFLIGAYVQNITQSRLSGPGQEKLPVVMVIGISFRPQDHIMINVEAGKMASADPTVKAGLEYGIRKKLYLRTGIQTGPGRNFFGVGFHPGRYKIDYALGFSGTLGFNHMVSLVYELKKPK